MAKRYIVDFQGLAREERQAAFEQIKLRSFMAIPITGPTGLEGANVTWDLPEDFPTSPAFPRGCTYRKV